MATEETTIQILDQNQLEVVPDISSVPTNFNQIDAGYKQGKGGIGGVFYTDNKLTLCWSIYLGNTLSPSLCWNEGIITGLFQVATASVNW